MACRNVEKAKEARQQLLGERGRVEVRQLDLSSLTSVRNFVAGIKKDNIKVHILINNAGESLNDLYQSELTLKTTQT